MGLYPLCPVPRRPFRATGTLAASRLKIPRSPDLDSDRVGHSRINVPISGLPLYATELLISAR